MIRPTYLFVIALLTSGCANVYVEDYPPLTPRNEPLFETVRVNGPSFQDTRLAGYNRSTSYTTDTTSFGNPYNLNSTNFTSSGTNTTVNRQFEYFDNRGLENVFVQLLENSRIARRVVPVQSPKEARIRFDAEVSLVGDTGAGKITWNVINSVLMFSLLPTPFLGNSRVVVEIRAYDDGEYVRSYKGESRTSWWLPGLWGLNHTKRDALEKSRRKAGWIAISRAVEAIVENPPTQ